MPLMYLLGDTVGVFVPHTKLCSRLGQELELEQPSNTTFLPLARKKYVTFQWPNTRTTHQR